MDKEISAVPDELITVSVTVDGLKTDNTPSGMKDERSRLQSFKWSELAKRGITPPKDDAERKQRLKDAHEIGY